MPNPSVHVPSPTFKQPSARPKPGTRNYNDSVDENVTDAQIDEFIQRHMPHFSKLPPAMQIETRIQIRRTIIMQRHASAAKDTCMELLDSIPYTTSVTKQTLENMVDRVAAKAAMHLDPMTLYSDTNRPKDYMNDVGHDIDQIFNVLGVSMGLNMANVLFDAQVHEYVIPAHVLFDQAMKMAKYWDALAPESERVYDDPDEVLRYASRIPDATNTLWYESRTRVEEYIARGRLKKPVWWNTPYVLNLKPENGKYVNDALIGGHDDDDDDNDTEEDERLNDDDDEKLRQYQDAYNAKYKEMMWRAAMDNDNNNARDIDSVANSVFEQVESHLPRHLAMGGNRHVGVAERVYRNQTDALVQLGHSTIQALDERQRGGPLTLWNLTIGALTENTRGARMNRFIALAGIGALFAAVFAFKSADTTPILPSDVAEFGKYTQGAIQTLTGMAKDVFEKGMTLRSDMINVRSEIGELMSVLEPSEITRALSDANTSLFQRGPALFRTILRARDLMGNENSIPLHQFREWLVAWLDSGRQRLLQAYQTMPTDVLGEAAILQLRFWEERADLLSRTTNPQDFERIAKDMVRGIEITVEHAVGDVSGTLSDLFERLGGMIDRLNDMMGNLNQITEQGQRMTQDLRQVGIDVPQDFASSVLNGTVSISDTVYTGHRFMDIVIEQLLTYDSRLYRIVTTLMLNPIFSNMMNNLQTIGLVQLAQSGDVAGLSAVLGSLFLKAFIWLNLSWWLIEKGASIGALTTEAIRNWIVRLAMRQQGIDTESIHHTPSPASLAQMLNSGQYGKMGWDTWLASMTASVMEGVSLGLGGASQFSRFMLHNASRLGTYLTLRGGLLIICRMIITNLLPDAAMNYLYVSVNDRLIPVDTIVLALMISWTLLGSNVIPRGIHAAILSAADYRQSLPPAIVRMVQTRAERVQRDSDAENTFQPGREIMLGSMQVLRYTSSVSSTLSILKWCLYVFIFLKTMIMTTNLFGSRKEARAKLMAMNIPNVLIEQLLLQMPY